MSVPRLLLPGGFSQLRMRRRALGDLPGGINQDPLDRYTLAHFGSGVVCGLLKVEWWQALLLSLGWDVLERILKDVAPQIWPHPSQDSLQHVAVDTAAWMLGWASARQYLLARSEEVLTVDALAEEEA